MLDKSEDIYSKFNDDIGYDFDKNLFKFLENNSKYNPKYNSFPSRYWQNIQANFIRSKGKFFNAVKNLYKNDNHFVLSNSESNQYIEKIRNIKNSIKSNGFYVIENFFDENTVEGIKEELLDMKYFSNLNIFKTLKLKSIKKGGHPDTTFQSSLTSKKIKKGTFLEKLFSNKFFKDVAGSYFESNPYLTASVSFFTKAKDKKEYTQEEIFKSAQNFHYDYSHLNFLKVFIYLTDIPAPEYGSHSFIKKTHAANFKYPNSKEDFIPSSLRQYYNRCYGGVIKDEWIEKNFSDEDINNFCFKKGSIIFEDTSGLHKGHNCTVGNREMISLIYSLSNISGSWTRNRQPNLDVEISKEENYFLDPILIKTKKKQIEEYNKYNKDKLGFINFAKNLKRRILNIF